MLVLYILVCVCAGIAAMFGPLAFVARWILSPIDRAAKFRKAPVRFSIGDFLCLFLAVQIPLTAIYRFVREGSEGAFWVFTIITWLVAPLIWFAAARALSKAGVTNGWHRFVCLGLIMPLVYYGLIPFTVIGLSFFGVLFDDPSMPYVWLLPVWFTLAILFYVSGVFVRGMLQQVKRDEPPISDRTHEHELARAAMYDDAAAATLHEGNGHTKVSGPLFK
jgi:hypothetical protein